MEFDRKRIELPWAVAEESERIKKVYLKAAEDEQFARENGIGYVELAGFLRSHRLEGKLKWREIPKGKQKSGVRRRRNGPAARASAASLRPWLAVRNGGK